MSCACCVPPCSSQDTLGVLGDDSRHRAVGIVSQQFALRFICDNRDMLGTLATLPASAIVAQSLSAFPFITIPSTLTGIAAVQAMVDNRLTALTVVDSESGVLVGCLTRKLLHALASIGTDDEFSEAMGWNVVDLLVRLQSDAGVPPGAALPIVHPSDTFGTVLEVMVGAFADVVHVVTADMIPSGVITPLDIIRAVRPPKGGL